MVICKICKKPGSNIYSAVFQGSVHTRCHERWLREKRKGKQRKKIMAVKCEGQMVEHTTQTEAKPV